MTRYTLRAPFPVSALATIVLGLATVAVAEPTGESYALAQSVFGKPPQTLLENIDGEWLPMSLLTGGIDMPADPGLIAEFTERFCGTERGGKIIESRLAGLTMSSSRPNGDTLVEWYDWVGGGQYRYNVDPEAYAAYVGVPGEGADADDKRMQIWAQLPNWVRLYRTGDDVLVIAPDKGGTSVFVRCPGA